MAIANATIGTSAAAIYTSSGNNAITTVIVCNTGSANDPVGQQVTLTLYAVPSGGSQGVGNMIVNALPIPGGETVTFDQEKMVLSNGDSLVAVASATNLTATVSTLSV